MATFEAHKPLIQGLRALGADVDESNFAANMRNPDYAEKVRTALAEGGADVPDSATFHQKYGYDLGSKSLAGHKQESVSAHKSSGSPVRDALQSMYSGARNVISKSVPITAIGALKSMTGPKGAIGSGNLESSIRESQRKAAAGEGLEGLLADPLNAIGLGLESGAGKQLFRRAAPATAERVATLATQAGKLAGKPAEAARAVASKAGAEKTVDVVSPYVGAALTGGTRGAAYGAAANQLDPNLKDVPLTTSLGIGAGLGGLTAPAGLALMQFGKSKFPGLNVEIDNRKVPAAAKQHVAENLDMILGTGVLPSGKGGLLSQSAARRAAAGEQYSKALVALNESHPEAVIDLAKLRAEAEQKLRSEYAGLGNPKFELALETPEGYRLPAEATDIMDQRVGNLRGTKLARLHEELGMSAPEYADYLGKQDAAGASVADRFRWAAQPTQLTPGEAFNTLKPVAPGAPLFASLLRASTRGEDLQPTLANLAHIQALSDDVARAGATGAVGSLPRILGTEGNTLAPNLVKRMLAEDEASRLASGRAINEEVSQYLTPTEFASDRRRLVDPKTWQNPQTGTPSEMAQDVGLALHDAGVGQLKAYPEYASTLGDADRAYKLEKDLQNVIRYPGPMGLSHRVNLPLWNGAVDPWLLASGLYKAGQWLRYFGGGNQLIEGANRYSDKLQSLFDKDSTATK